MDEQKRDLGIQPEITEEVQPTEIPVEQKYNFDLFTENRGKNIDSGAQSERSERRTPVRRERSVQRPRAAAPSRAAGDERRASKEMPTDIGEAKEPIQAVELDDDFQLNPVSKPETVNVARETVPEKRVPVGRVRGGANAPARKVGEPKRSEKKVGLGEAVAGYFMNNKIKVIITAALSLLAIIFILSMGSGMRVDIFGYTNGGLITFLLVLSVVLIAIGVFIKSRFRVIYSIMWVAIILMISGCFAAVVLSGVCDFFGISRKRTISDFTIPEGGNWGTKTIAEELYEDGIINHPTLFRLYSKIKGNDGSYQWGNYELNSEMDYTTIMNNLKKGNTAATVKVRIPEASNIDDIMAILEENGVCTRDQFISAMEDYEYKYTWVNAIPRNTVRYRFEGYLYPDTYNFYASEPSVENARKAIDKMLNAFNSHLPENWQELVEQVGQRLGKTDMTLNDCMAIGSILELEASGNEQEMKNVASVFYNRLTWSEPRYLGSTPTYYYPDNRYNTNAGPMTVKTEDGGEKTYPAGKEGIPPGPQCALTEASILASLQPADTSYTYFVTDVDMNFYYNKSYTAHLNTIAKLRREGKWA